MLKNYLTVAFRIMRRHKAFTFINIAGLALGMACSIMIALFIVHETNYDLFYEKTDRIFRVYVDAVDEGQNFRGAWTAPPMARALLQDFPEIEAAARLSPWPGEYVISTRGKLFLEKGIKFADTSFFEIFSYPFIYGDPSTALDDPAAIVLTRDIAEKYFGHENPLGETLTLVERKRDFKVTGVIENPPLNSHISFDMMASLKSNASSAGTSWGQHTYFTYVLLREDASAPGLEIKFPDFVRRHYGAQFFADTGMSFDEYNRQSGNRYGFRLESLPEIHLNKNVMDNLSVKGNTGYLRIFSAVALFVLLIACFNFMNLSTARFAHRSREVGIRKVIGSHRKQLVAQFLGESLFLSSISLLLALGLTSLALPAFAGLVQRPLVIADLGRGFFPLYLGGITLLVGLAAGSYPALFLSSFPPQATIKGWLSARGKSHVFMRRGLVLVQFMIGFAVIFGTGVIFRQMSYLRNQTLGFDKDQVVVIHRAKTLGDSGDAFDRELLSHPEILEVSRSESLPGRHFDPNGHRLEGWPATKDTILMTTYVDARFADLLGLEVIDGRFFSPEIPSDKTSAVVINERAVRELGLSEPVGKRLHKEYGGAKEGEFVTIIGVLRDFHFDSLHHEIQPMLLRFLSPGEWAYTSAKVRAERLPQTLALIERTWAAFTGGQPFEYSFLDEDFGALYDSERRAGKTLAIFSALAILVACLGLYGLISFAAEQRMKEIGIRKTFGASVANLTGLLSREVLILVIAAVIVAALPAYYFVQKWLQNFAFRIAVSPLMFAATAAAILVVAFLSIAARAFRTAAANPIDTLRYE